MSVTKIPSATSKAVSTLVVTQAMELLDRSGVVERLEQWSPKRRVILNFFGTVGVSSVFAIQPLRDPTFTGMNPFVILPGTAVAFVFLASFVTMGVDGEAPARRLTLPVV